jgi:hypothetical protein
VSAALIATTARQVRVSTRAYRSSHGAEPRGRGYWMFVFGKEDYDLAEEAVICPIPMGANGMPTFGEAKRWAKAEAARRGVDLVGVCS